MNTIRAIVIPLLLVMISITNPGQAQQVPSQKIDGSEAIKNGLKRILDKSKGKSTAHSPSIDELRVFEELCKQSLTKNSDPQELLKNWKAAGWNAELLRGTNILVISENENQKQGRGVYAFRLGSSSRLVLQAPHRFFDRYTGAIARSLFAEHDIVAVAWNSAHRKKVDLAHQSRHHINSFSRAIVAARPMAVIVQLHGFSGKDRTGTAKTAKIILSDSTRFPARHARQSAIQLKEALGSEAVRLYPIEVSQLGGTTNSQAKLLRGIGATRFLHVEMNVDFRQQLNKDAKLRAKLYGGFTQPTQISK